jgi:hypothetical protein
MNCKVVQKQLLTMENPERPSRRVQSHLAGCAACRDWQRRLVVLERNVARLPVPQTGARVELLRRLLQEMPASASGQPGTVVLEKPSAGPPETLRDAESLDTLRSVPAVPPSRPVVPRWRRIAPTAAAATVLIAAAAWWMLRGGSPPDQNLTAQGLGESLVSKVLQSDLRLAQAETPTQRLLALADLADDLHMETRTLAREADVAQLAGLARHFGDVVRKGLVPGAQEVSPDMRREVLQPIADRLARTSRDAEALARGLAGPAIEPLRVIATAAREGDNGLRVLLPESKP